MNSETTENTYDSLVDDINHQYFGQADAGKLKILSMEPVADPRKLVRAFTQEFTGGKDYHLDTENSTEMYQFFVHNSEKDKRVLRIESPYTDKPSILIEIPKTSASKEAQRLIYHWKDVKNMVMFDQESFELLYDVFAAYRTKDPLIVSGPPAKAKTFIMWVASSMIEVPYARISCTEGTDEEQLKGAPGNIVTEFGSLNAEELLSQTIIQKQIQMAIKEYKDLTQHQSDGRRYFEVTSFLQSVRTLLDLDTAMLKETGNHLPVTDTNLLPLYSIIQQFTGISLVRTREFGFIDTDLNIIIENGGMCILDEFDRIKKENIQIQMNPYMEPDTEKITVDVRRTPQTIRRHPDAWVAITINDVKALPPTILSRSRKVKLERVSRQYIKNILLYYFTGNDPDIWIKGKRAKGRRDVASKLRVMENMPYRDEFIESIVNIYSRITEMLKHDLGHDTKNKSLLTDLDQRTIGMLANDLLANFTSQHSMVKGEIVNIKPDWYMIAMASCENIFEAGMAGDAQDIKTDRGKVHALIKEQKVFDKLKALSKGKPEVTTEATHTKKGDGVAPKW
jgi:MoxR-like ATPase